MQAMDEEPEPKLPVPNHMSITSNTTRPVKVVLRPPGVCGPRVELVLRLAMLECHTWVAIGGRTGRVCFPRRLSKNIWLALDDDGPAHYLRRGDHEDCRRLIGGAIAHSLRKLEAFRCLTPAYWDQAVPVDLECDIAVAVAVAVAHAAQRRCGGGTFQAIVDIRVRFEFVYSEPKAMLMACDKEDGGGGLTGRSGNGGDGDGEAPSCSICFDEMWWEAGDEVTDLPACTHSFHRGCIAEWFDKASTCPVCRRDQLDYLPSDYWDLHGRMATDPDSLPYYL